MSERYNGWTNYETWLVNLWMDNERGSQEFFREQAKEIYGETASMAVISKPTGLTVQESARMRVADWLKEHYDENIPEVPGVYGDLLGAALSSVNWDEIARHYIDAIVEEESNGVQNGR
jgi:hypothetical protein